MGEGDIVTSQKRGRGNAHGPTDGAGPQGTVTPILLFQRVVEMTGVFVISAVPQLGPVPNRTRAEDRERVFEHFENQTRHHNLIFGKQQQTNFLIQCIRLSFSSSTSIWVYVLITLSTRIATVNKIKLLISQNSHSPQRQIINAVSISQ